MVLQFSALPLAFGETDGKIYSFDRVVICRGLWIMDYGLFLEKVFMRFYISDAPLEFLYEEENEAEAMAVPVRPCCGFIMSDPGCWAAATRAASIKC